MPQPHPLPPRRHHQDPAATAIQTVAVGLVAALATLIAVTTATNLQLRGIPVGLQFLTDPAGFRIAEAVLPFKPRDSNLWAALVGIGNTLFLSALVIVASTIWGVLVALARLSTNPMAARLAQVYVEAVRNTPPVLLLIFLYGLWSRAAPVADATRLLPGLFVSQRGLAIPAMGLQGEPWLLGLVVLAAAAGLAQVVRASPRRRWIALGLGLTALAALMLAGLIHIRFEAPQVEGADMVGGIELTPEFVTVALGLTLYTAGFIAEIVRSGIEAVSRGQWDAADALGFGRLQTLKLVVFPQMMRVIVPPMTSQYINTVKNSTLAIAVGYSDFMTVMGTIINKTSHAVEGVTLIVLVYLAINLAISAALNVFNARTLMVERQS